MRSSVAACVLALVAASAGLAVADNLHSPRGKHLVIVLVDGLRWQEVFAGADETLLTKDAGVKDVERTRRAFWRESLEERRAALLPFLWTVVSHQGQIFGDQSRGSVMRVSNQKRISYPGYAELLVGFADPRIDGNEKKTNPNPTVLEWLHQRPGFAERVATIAAWDTVPFIVRRDLCSFYVNAGLEAIPPARVADSLTLLNRLRQEIPVRWTAEPFDAVIFYSALEYLKHARPRVLFITFGETDEWAHEGRYDEYLAAARTTDGFLRTLWEAIQTLSDYRDCTTLLIVNDHGRGSGPEEWKSHGDKHAGSENVWCAIIGPDTPALGVRADHPPLTLGQLAATAAAAVGEDYCAAVPQAAPPLPEAISPKLCDRQPPARPSPAQLAWHDCEIGMFIHFAPNTYTDQEYDDLSLPLEEFNPAALDTEQWADAAVAMGAKYIVLVAKHAGGFCLWQTDTTAYGVRCTPWRGGKGDVLADLAASCRKRDLKLGVYLSPQDCKHGAEVGGKCQTADAQEAYNALYRAQLAEVLSRYGEIFEVWFDGNIVVPVGDILERYAPHAVVFQGPHASIRWVGNEDGVAPYPAWNAVAVEHARAGEATAEHGDPEGTVWLPNECDARMRSTWFWNTKNADTLKSVDQLMDMYYRSVGHSAVLLLNHTPDPTGRVPDADVQRGAEFGAEIRRRFGTPLAQTAGRGVLLALTLESPSLVDHVVTMEDLAYGERVREYVIEGRVGPDWRLLAQGTAIGHKKIDRFEPVSVTALRLRVTTAAAEPRIRRLAAYHVARERS